MANEPDSLVLEHLRHIRASQERMELDVDELKTRVSVLKQMQGQVLVLLGALNQRIVRLDERLRQVERRIGLVEA